MTAQASAYFEIDPDFGEPGWAQRVVSNSLFRIALDMDIKNYKTQRTNSLRSVQKIRIFQTCSQLIAQLHLNCMRM